MDAFTRMDLEQVISDLAPRRNPKDDPLGALENASGDLSNITDKGLPLSDLEDARCYLDDATDDMGVDDLRGVIKKVHEYLSRTVTALDEYSENLTARADDVYAAVRAMTDEPEADTIDPDSLISELEFRGYEVRRIDHRLDTRPVQAEERATSVVAAHTLPPAASPAPAQSKPRRPRAPRKPRLALVPAEEPKRRAAWGADL